MLQKELLSVGEAARRLGLSCSYLNKLRCVGGGPRYMKVGRRVIYLEDDLNAWLASCRRRSTSDGEHTSEQHKRTLP